MINESNLIAIQNIEDSIQIQSYAGAQGILNSFTPANKIDSAFKTIYSIWVSNRLSVDTIWLSSIKNNIDTVWTDSINYTVETFLIDTLTYSIAQCPLNDSLVQILTDIAEKDAVLENPAAYAARAILWGERHLLINDPERPFYPNITGYVILPCSGGSDTGVLVKVYNEFGIFTGIQTSTQDSGFFVLDGQTLSTLNPALNYYVSVSGLGGAENSDTTSWYNLAMQSYHILDCTGQLNKKSANTKKSNSDNDIIIYPNPSSKGFTLSNMPSNWRIEIKDIVGKKVWEKEGSGNTEIPNGMLVKGIYSAVITNLNTNEQYSKKLLVQ